MKVTFYDMIFLSCLTMFDRHSWYKNSSHIFAMILISFFEQLAAFAVLFSFDPMSGTAIVEGLKESEIYGFSIASIVIYLALPIFIVGNYFVFIRAYRWKHIQSVYSDSSDKAKRVANTISILAAVGVMAVLFMASKYV